MSARISSSFDMRRSPVTMALAPYTVGAGRRPCELRSRLVTVVRLALEVKRYARHDDVGLEQQGPLYQERALIVE
jgi:hypothetical protein